MSKRNRHSSLKFYQLILFIFVIAVVGYLLITIIRVQNPKGSDENLQYLESNEKLINNDNVAHSLTLQFSIELPKGFSFTENSGIVAVFTHMLGKIDVVRNSTNFKNLHEYLSLFDQRRNLEVTNQKTLTIDGYEAVVRNVNFPDQNVYLKSYYIYIDNSVFIISTDQPELFDELDQVARSFRYTGEVN